MTRTCIGSRSAYDRCVCRSVSVAILVVLLGGCGEERGGSPEDERAEGPSRTDEEALALTRANAAADQLATALRARLRAAMAEGGPPGAVEVCSQEAPSIAATAARETGARVGRSSLRLRNPSNAAPSWVASWLREQGERSAAGVEGFARIEDGHARVVRPIVVEAPCLSCHGSRETIAPEVVSSLDARYPDDRATGYAAGDLRGALWAEAEVPAER